MRVECLAQDHNTMSPARARTWTARSRDEHTDHEATAPPHLIDSTLTINRWLSMVAVCIARNGACLNGLAKVVEDGDLRFKKIK